MISIEGNVGVGKSTVLGELENVREERVDSWTLLPAFYRDSKKYSFAFQLQVVASYADAEVSYLERSAHSAYHVFSAILHADGFLDDEEMQLLKTVIDKLPKSDHHIYLRLPAEQCLERIKKRARNGEESISLEYLKKIEERHDAIFKNVIYLEGHETPSEIARLITQFEVL